MLDTVVKNGHTTTLDALWGAIPVVTMPRERMEARATASAYESMEFSPLVVHSLKEYEDLAVRMAHDRALLQEIKEEVRTYRSPGQGGRSARRVCFALFLHLSFVGGSSTYHYSSIRL